VCTEHAPKRVPCVSADLQCPAHRRSTLTSELRNIVSLPYTGRISVEAGFRLHTLPVNSAERTLFCPRAVRNIPKHRAVWIITPFNLFCLSVFRFKQVS
jgi:hypothetical protein